MGLLLVHLYRQLSHVLKRVRGNLDRAVKRDARGNLMLSTGTAIEGCHGVVGLRYDESGTSRLAYGYDDHIDTHDGRQTMGSSLTRLETIELVDFMVVQWLAYREALIRSLENEQTEPHASVAAHLRNQQAK